MHKFALNSAWGQVVECPAAAGERATSTAPGRTALDSLPAMFRFTLPRPTLLLGIATAVCLLLMLGLADRSSAYYKPAGGKWNFQNLFDYTKYGSLALSKDGKKVTKLVLVPGEGAPEACGKAKIRLQTRVRVRRYRKVSGRYAVGNLRKGLFVGKPMVFKQDKKRFRAKLEILWDETGRLAETGMYERGDCYIKFFARKGR